jgi:hypothetical protein
LQGESPLDGIRKSHKTFLDYLQKELPEASISRQTFGRLVKAYMPNLVVDSPQ